MFAAVFSEAMNVQPLRFAGSVGGERRNRRVFRNSNSRAARRKGDGLDQLGLVALDCADDGRFVWPVPETDECLAGADVIDQGQSNAAKDLLREGGKIAEHPEEIEPLPEREPEITGPDWGQDFHNTTVQLVGHALPYLHEGGLPDHWQFGQERRTLWH